MSDELADKALPDGYTATVTAPLACPATLTLTEVSGHAHILYCDLDVPHAVHKATIGWADDDSDTGLVDVPWLVDDGTPAVTTVDDPDTTGAHSRA